LIYTIRAGTSDYSGVADCSKKRSTEYTELTETVIQLGVPRDTKIALPDELNLPRVLIMNQIPS